MDDAAQRDVAGIHDQDSWPCWPVLPLKSRLPRAPGAFPELGCLLAPTLTRVYVGANIFDHGSITHYPTKDYESVEALVEEWIVD